MQFDDKNNLEEPKKKDAQPTKDAEPIKDAQPTQPTAGQDRAKKSKLLLISILSAVAGVLVIIAVILGVVLGGKKQEQGTNPNPDINNPNTPPEQTHTHTPLPAVRENEILPTCTIKGSYDEVIKCSTCGEQISRTPKSVDTTSVHTYSTEWTFGDTQHWQNATCIHTTEKSNVANHTLQNEICTVCGYGLHNLTFKTLQKVANVEYSLKVAYSIVEFNFEPEIIINSGTTYAIYTDPECTDALPTKIVSLGEGDNTFYILSQYKDAHTRYTITIRRRPMYTVTYNTNDGTSVAEARVEEGNTIPQPTTTKSGYTFVGWQINETNVTFPYTVNENTQFTAIFTPNNYTATLQVNGGDDLETVEKNVTYGSLYTLPIPTRTGYTFDGWYNGENKITNSNGESIANWSITQNATITAHWQINTHLLTLNTSNSQAGSVTGGNNYAYGSSVTIKATTNKGYTFLGWYDNNDTQLTQNLEYTFTINSDTTYTAKWTPCPISIAIDHVLGGTISGLPNATVVGEEYTINAISSSRLGYTFAGWYNGESLLTKNSTYTFTMPSSGEYTYTATWEIDPALSNFEFTSTPQTCTLLGVKDKTITSITIPNYVTNIDDYIFDECLNLTELILPDNLKNMHTGRYMTVQNTNTKDNAEYVASKTNPYFALKQFTGNSTMTSFTVPNETKMVLSFAFLYNGSKIQNITLPDSLEFIEGFAFDGCDNLVYNTYNGGKYLGNSSNPYMALIEIDRNATSITTHEKTKIICGSAFFYNQKLESLTITNSVKSLSLLTLWRRENLKITVEQGNAAYTSKGNCLIDIANKTLITCFDDSVIPNDGSVEHIGRNAYANCKNLKTLTIPQSVVSISNGAFYLYKDFTNLVVEEANAAYVNKGNCLIEVESKILISGFEGSVIPTDGSVEKIRAKAFENCKITSIVIPDSVVSIGEYAFSKSSIESAYISSNVETIASYTFNDCVNLKSVTLGENSKLNLIDYSAFYKCTALETITYTLSKSTWNSIEKNEGWDDQTPTYTIICSDGNIPKN